MRPIPSVTTAEYILTPHAVARRVRYGTQPAVWTLHVIGEEVAEFSEHPAGGPHLGASRDELVSEVAAKLAGDSGGDYRRTALEAVESLSRLALDIVESEPGPALNAAETLQGFARTAKRYSETLGDGCDTDDLIRLCSELAEYATDDGDDDDSSDE